MEEFAVYAVLGVHGPPQRLISADGSPRVCVALPPSVQQVVLFSRGPWGRRLCVSAELDDSARTPITIGKLTPYNRSLSWEQWEEDTWTDTVTLRLSVEEDTLGDPLWSEPEQILTVKEYTPKDSVAPPGGRDRSLKRKRGRDEGGANENSCPNVSAAQSTPSRRPRGPAHSTPSRRPRGPAHSAPQGGDEAAVKNPPVPAAKTKKPLPRTPSAAPLSPSGRWGQTLCPIDAHTALLIGGQGSRMHFCKDPMWKLCTEDLGWVAAEALAEGPTPEARIGHTAAFDPDSKRIFVFGGSKNNKWFNDVHILDTRRWRWSTVQAQGKVPPLAYHSCSLFRGELFVLGGVFPRPHPEPDGCSGALYIFDPELSVWYQPIVTGDTPPPRSGHSACLMQEKIFVFGGWDTPVCFNDMYMLDLGLMEFSAVKTHGTPPSPRSWHGSVVLSDTKFLVHGGYNGNAALADAFVFDIDTGHWTEVALPELSLPRAGHSIIAMETAPHRRHDQGTRTLLVFGGGDNEGAFYSDLITVSVDGLLGAL